ncbi:hypothetical protein EJ05DRAFT_101723 [Pseudovirgaria hyperparasitica]|uniref:Dienelactone hydrolase domain-containing protein n=1 Tax=Pseudovirgaria hyperparasitica TaxID=470096 RepID=A0A6A6VXR1_9PEZI|nr:uncharacterized protein EJ05DRAFT_101723 [Pseudovirgaria hyperparasitica]KAF2755448.1 hypothetical protein EJ05DRAFT_101723 [Pseudovirgaria hyperparasitica]
MSSDSPLPKACCALAPVTPGAYTPKGTYEDMAGMKTYTTGPRDASLAVVFVYDAFGFTSQTLQGADLIAAALPARVFMPDLLDGGMDRALFPADTPAKQKLVGDMFGPTGKGDLTRCASHVASMPAQIRASEPDIASIVALGLCWGGKVVVLASNNDSTRSGTAGGFVASAQAHPSRLAEGDARGLRMPHLVMASRDEDAVDVRAFEAVDRPAGSVVCTYPDMRHGWMGSRAELDSEEGRDGFRRGYEQFVGWVKEVVG